MTDVTPEKQPSKDEIIEDAVVVDESAVPVEATVEPSEPVAPAPHVVYVQTPVPPKKAGNRGIGSVLAIVSGLIYAVAFALVVVIILAVQTGQVAFGFIAQPSFYVPVLFYIIGLVLLVLILNRAGWAAYVLGSILVGLLVYFGTIGVLLLGGGIVLETPAVAAELFNSALGNPFAIAAGLVAREVSLWVGAFISRRGRKLKVRNAEAHADWERELAAKRAEGERAASAAAAG